MGYTVFFRTTTKNYVYFEMLKETIVFFSKSLEEMHKYKHNFIKYFYDYCDLICRYFKDKEVSNNEEDSLGIDIFY